MVFIEIFMVIFFLGIFGGVGYFLAEAVCFAFVEFLKGFFRVPTASKKHQEMIDEQDFPSKEVEDIKDQWKGWEWPEEFRKNGK